MQSTARVATQSWAVPSWGCSRDFRGYLRVQVLSAVAPGTEYTSLSLSNSTAQSVHADHHNLQGSTNVVLPLKLPPNGGDLWVELQPGDVVDGPVEERVDGRGKRWLGTTLKLQRGQPLLLDLLGQVSE